jgi:ribosomal protein S20
MTNYVSMSQRIKAATSEEDLAKLEKSLDRLYNAGIFSVNEFSRLDSLILKRYAQIED